MVEEDEEVLLGKLFLLTVSKYSLKQSKHFWSPTALLHSQDG